MYLGALSIIFSGFCRKQWHIGIYYRASYLFNKLISFNRIIYLHDEYQFPFFWRISPILSSSVKSTTSQLVDLSLHFSRSASFVSNLGDNVMSLKTTDAPDGTVVCRSSRLIFVPLLSSSCPCFWCRRGKSYGLTSLRVFSFHFLEIFCYFTMKYELLIGDKCGMFLFNK